MDDPELKALFRRNAVGGEGEFAVAFALLELADAQREIAGALQRLGNGNAATSHGAVENLSVQVEKIAHAISEAGSVVADAVVTKSEI